MRKYAGMILIMTLLPWLSWAQPSGTGLLEKGMEMLGGSAAESSGTALSQEEISSGLKEALKTGTARVVSSLGRENGFYLDEEAHIPLPESLAGIRDVLSRVGMAGMLDDLELQMNRAAEKAAPRAGDMFITAVSDMTIEDVMDIYQGQDDAATRYFQKRMSGPLREEFTPVVREKLEQTGAVKTYQKMMGRYEQIPMVPDISADLTSHVVDLSIGTIFDRVAMEEAAIRNNPARRTTELLRKVFSSKQP